MRKLSEHDVLAVRTSNADDGHTFVDDVLLYRSGGVEIEIDAAAIDTGLRGFVLNTIGVVAIIVTFMVIVTYTFLSIFLVRPLKALLRNMENIAGQDADLTSRLEVRSSDEIGSIADSFNQFVERIRGVVMLVRRRAVSRKRVGSAQNLERIHGAL